MTTDTGHRAARALGTYGLRLRGVDEARELLMSATADWPIVDVLVDVPASGQTIARDRLGDDVARYAFTAGGEVIVERSPARAVFRFPEGRQAPGAADLVHPYLCAPLATMHHWNGSPAFHGGAFVIDGAAWIVLGAKGAGKSTLLAALAALGVSVLTDDLAVVSGRHVLSGPRCIDLRRDAAMHLGVGDCLGVVGIRERWRYGLRTVPPSAPLRGWIVPGWGESRIRAVRAAERLQLLFTHLALRTVPSQPDALLGLAALPCHRFVRPRTWATTADAEHLLATIAE